MRESYSTYPQHRLTWLFAAIMCGGGLAPAGYGQACTTVDVLSPPNTRPVPVLSQLDIDQDSVPDGSADSDGDGLPDNWEKGGVDVGPSLTKGASFDRLVEFSAPTAIGPGTPPTFVFFRRAVSTEACLWDSDGDGLSDFIEVFGLKYIDDNGNGRLDFALDANGNPVAGSEWFDANGDGLPSVGEFPLDNSSAALNLDNDFDGFVFTDPTNPDTDGDGLDDRADPDPLINPQTFNVQGLNFERGSVAGDVDLDNDGLGNGSDFGNDVIEQVDQPADLTDLLQLFRSDLLRLAVPVIPEATIEDLLGADWDGNGLYRLTDVRDWTPIVRAADITPAAFPEFWVNGRALFREQSFADIQAAFAAAPAPGRYAIRGLGLGYQTVLRPANLTNFIPDRRVWAILYAWRVPGFDIDGNGFTGVPSGARGTTAANPANRDLAAVAISAATGLPTDDTPFALVSAQSTDFWAFDDRIALVAAGGNGFFDGQISIPGCASIGSAASIMTLAGFLALMGVQRRRKARRVEPS